MLGMLTLLPTDSYTSTMYSVRLILCVQFTSSTSTTNTDFLNNINNVVYLQLNLKRKKKIDCPVSRGKFSQRHGLFHRPPGPEFQGPGKGSLLKGRRRTQKGFEFKNRIRIECLPTESN